MTVSDGEAKSRENRRPKTLFFGLEVGIVLEAMYQDYCEWLYEREKKVTAAKVIPVSRRHFAEILGDRRAIGQALYKTPGRR